MKAGRPIEILTIGANLAVLVGLVFVGIEVRNSRAAAEAQIADGIAEGFMHVNELAIENPSVACIWVLGWHSPESLSDLQAAQFSMDARMVFKQYARVYSLYETVLVAEENWSFTASSAHWLLNTPGGTTFIDGNPGAPQSFQVALRSYPPVPQDFMMGRKLPESCPLDASYSVPHA